MKKQIFRVTAQALLTVLMAGMMVDVASAHPHVWVKMKNTLTFNEAGLIDGIDVEWVFDDAYAKAALEGLDVNNDGYYSASELEPYTRENLEALKDYDYFTSAKSDGKPIAVGLPTNSGQLYSNDKLQLHFRLPFEKPVDPRQHVFTLNSYDPEFFIDFSYQKSEDDVDVAGAIPDVCKLFVKPVPSNDELDKTRKMLATKGREWKPEDDNMDFGTMFSETVQINCAT